MSKSTGDSRFVRQYPRGIFEFDWTGSPVGVDVRIGRSPRYRFVVQVESEALHSVVHDAPAPPEIDTTTKGWVKLIDKSWYLGRGEGRHTLLEPIEGMTQEDVG